MALLGPDALSTQPDRGGAWQATDLLEMARPITKWAGLVSRPDRLPELVRAAFRAATSGRGACPRSTSVR